MAAARTMVRSPGTRPAPGAQSPPGPALAPPAAPTLRWPRLVSQRETEVGLARSTPAGPLARVGLAWVTVYCLAFPFVENAVAIANSPGWTMRPAGWVLLGTACYVPLYLRHVRYFLRGARPPHAAWSLAAIAAVTAGFTPLAQGYWLRSYFALGVCLLITGPWRWALPGLAALAAIQIPLGAGLDQTAGIAPAGGIYYPITLIWRVSAVFVPLWLFRALRQLEAARHDLAQDAVLRERLRLDDRLRETVGAALAAITARGERLAGQARSDPAAAAPELADLARQSRRTLADARRLLSGLHQPSPAAELETAAALLTAAGIRTRIVTPDGGLPAQSSEPFRAELRTAIARLLRDDPARDRVLLLAGADGHLHLEVEVSSARPDGNEVGAP
jgi:two-component system, NarL family, sensor histidine kinase DesK